MKQLHLRLDDQTYDVIAKAGKDNNVSLQDLAQKALAAYKQGISLNQYVAKAISDELVRQA